MTFSVPSVGSGPRPPEPNDSDGLWGRIKAHPFDKPGAEMPFSKRLAQENGWPQEFASRVIEEYRRFVYLACIAEQEVTPSNEVDQVWHLHLAYSRDYWGEFCEKVLRRPLHHGPTEGGASEHSRYEANYRRALALYKETFGEAVPMDIWPPAQIRFAPDAEFVRVNRALFTISPKRDRTKRKPVMESTSYWLVRLSLTGIILVALAAMYDPRLAVMAGPYILPSVILLGIVAFIAPAVASGIRRGLSEPGQIVIRQPQHGFVVTFAIAYGVASSIEAAAVSSPMVMGDSSGGGAGDGFGGGSGEGGSGCGGGGCGGGGCGGGGCGGC